MRPSAGLLIAVGLFLAAAAAAQDYPVKPIRIISGPGPDAVARLFGRRFTEAWGQQVVAESLPAAGGRVAAEAVAKAPPDGYTLLNATSSFLVAAALGVSPVDLGRDTAAVALTNFTPFVLAVPASLPVESVKELVALARARPGQLNYASGGNGTVPHIAAEVFKRLSGTDVVHVPYKSADQAAAAVLASQVQMMFTGYAVVGGQARAGKVRLLAVSAAARSRLAPELPTVAEAGVPGFDLVGWNGLVAPQGTPAAIIARLNAEVHRALQSAEIQQQFLVLGFDPPPAAFGAERFAEFMRADGAKWARLVRETGVKID